MLRSRRYSYSESKAGIWRATETIIADMATLAKLDKAVRLWGMLVMPGDGGITSSVCRMSADEVNMTSWFDDDLIAQ
jgi:hypothetical protein